MVGITPGWTQMEMAMRVARSDLVAGGDALSASRAAKSAAAFVGSMRANLSAQLDTLGLPEFLGIRSTGALFADQAHLLHATSALRYPVFHRGRNYSGHGPKPWDSALLWRYATSTLVEELRRVPRAVVVPLGKVVEGTLERLVASGLVEGRRFLRGFPHPSGANGHRARLFAERRTSLEKALRDALGVP